MTTPDARIRRPRAARTRPLRNLSQAFQSHVARTDAVGTVEGAVARAYQVIEDYMRRGREAARGRCGAPGREEASVTNSRTEDAQAQWTYWAEMARTWSALMTQWMSMGAPWMPGMGGFGAGGDGQAPGTNPGQAWPFPGWPGMPFQAQAQAQPAVRPPAVFAVEARSKAAVLVQLELQDGSAAAFNVAPLQAATPGDPPLAEVAVVPGPCVRVRVVVPDGQKAGTYAGSIVDRDRGVVCGTVRVVVEPGEAATTA